MSEPARTATNPPANTVDNVTFTTRVMVRVDATEILRAAAELVARAALGKGTP